MGLEISLPFACRTIENIANGCHTLAVLWQSAWKEGNGAAIGAAELVAIDRPDLIALYSKKSFVPSYALQDPKFKAAL